ncbi:MAG: hypothetical protein F6K01_29595 [Okeania sp. SIO1I7]|nr:hypothetical protein [Okeania sp. SIO1I7]
MLIIHNIGVGELVYDINLNYLGVNPPLAPPPPLLGGEVRSQEGKKRRKRKNRRRRRKFFDHFISLFSD